MSRSNHAKLQACSPPQGWSRMRRIRCPIDCAANAVGGGRAGSHPGTGWRADAHAGNAHAGLADLLGAAGHRQNHGGAAVGGCDRTAFRTAFGGIFRGRRSEEGVRRGARAARDRQGDAAVRRRGAPVQSRAAGFVSAGDGRRHRGAGRRHHRKSLVRAQRRAYCRGRAFWCFIRSTRPRSKNCSSMPRTIEGRKLPLDAEARAVLVRMADGDGRAALTLAEEVWRAAREGEIFNAAQLAGDPAAPRADLRQVGRRTLQPDLGAA